jgi:hypothetical protein
MNTQLLNQTLHQIKTAKPQAQQGLNNQAALFVNDLFRSLQVAYPAWKQAFGTEQDLELTKKSWIRAFTESGITQKEQIALGMKRARQDQSDFFPSSGKFIAWCKPRPEDFNLSSSSEAWREVCRHCHEQIKHPWSSPAVYEAGERVEFFNVRSGEVREKEFADVYEQVCLEVMKGQKFSGPNAVVNETTLQHHTNGKEVSARQKNNNLAKGNAALSGLKGLFR